MKILVAITLVAAMASPSLAQTNNKSTAMPQTLTNEDVRAVSPALDRYMRQTMDGDLWQRPQLSPRDRSVVTLAVLISRGQSVDLAGQLRRAMDNGVTAAEISEIITHLAFYSGLANAQLAVLAARQVFAERGIGSDQLPAASPKLLPIDETTEAKRAAAVEQSAGSVSPGLVKFTGELLFQDLWLRPDLAPRDRSLVTVASLIANGQVGQIPFHLNRAMDNGLTKEQAGEAIAQVAFYAGWPNAFSAVPVAADVFKSRAK